MTDLPPPGAVVRPALVGRARELAVLTGLVDAARSGRGGLALVGGEPGIGKTRLVDELVDRARQAGLEPWAVVACREEGAPPFWVWRRAFVDAAHRSAGATSDALRRAAEVLDDDAAALPYGDRRVDRFDQVAAALGALDGDAPVLLVLDDLQWADAGSLALLAHLRADLPRTAAAVVGTYRVDEVGPEHALAPLLAGGDVHVLRLLPLPPDQLGALAAAFAGVDLVAGQVDALVTATGGNPLFARELVRLAGEGAGLGRVDEVGALPDTVRAVIGRRLDRLPAADRALVDAIAVVGSVGDPDGLAALAGTDVGAVLDGLDRLARAGLLSGTRPEDAFTHALIRQVAIDALRPRRRAELHLAHADALAAAAPASEPSTIAHHYREALVLGGREAAGRWAARAGEQALAALAYEDARDQLRAALELGQPDEPVARTEVLLALGEAELRTGDRDAAADVFESAFDLASVTGRHDHAGLAALGFGAGPSGFEVVLADDRQIEMLEAALAQLPVDDSAVRVRVGARLSVAGSHVLDPSRRLSLASDAVDMARRLDDPGVLAYARSALCDAQAGPDHVEERLAHASEMLALATRCRDREMELLARRLRIVAHLERGDLVSFGADVRAYERTSDRVRRPLYAWFVPLWRATAAMTEARWDDALALVAEAERIGEEAASYNAGLLGLVARSNVYLLSGDPRADQVLAVIGDRYPEVATAPGADVITSLAPAIAGDLDLAEERFVRRDPSGLSAIPEDSEWLGIVAYNGLVAELLDVGPVAAAAEELLRPHADAFVVDGIGAGFFGSVHGWLAPLAHHRGDAEGARAHRAAAVAANRAAGAHHLADLVERTGYPIPVTAAARPDRSAASDRMPPATGPTASLVREGDQWTLAYGGSTARVRASKGIADLALLVAAPGRELAALDLASPPAGGPATARSADGAVDVVLDDTARRAYRDRIQELQEELDEADAAHDLGRSARLSEELDLLVDQLAAATGLGGRARRTGSDVERARKAVAARIGDALRRLDDVHPAAARHLRHSIRTGTYCSYRPETDVVWHVEP